MGTPFGKNRSGSIGRRILWPTPVPRFTAGIVKYATAGRPHFERSIPSSHCITGTGRPIRGTRWIAMAITLVSLLPILWATMGALASGQLAWKVPPLIRMAAVKQAHLLLPFLLL